jgi:hypothetical protein
MEKGIWILNIPSIPATSCRGRMGAAWGCVDVDSCRSVGLCVVDQV